MLDGLRAALESTGYDFTFAAWRQPPGDRDYGVYFCDGQDALSTGAGPASEIMLTGYIDLYTKDPSGDPKRTVESALNALGCFYKLESIQFEEESGYIHYEWTWRDDNGAISFSGDR